MRPSQQSAPRNVAINLFVFLSHAFCHKLKVWNYIKQIKLIVCKISLLNIENSTLPEKVTAVENLEHNYVFVDVR